MESNKSVVVKIKEVVKTVCQGAVPVTSYTSIPESRLYLKQVLMMNLYVHPVHPGVHIRNTYTFGTSSLFKKKKSGW